MYFILNNIKLFFLIPTGSSQLIESYYLIEVFRLQLLFFYVPFVYF